MDWGGTAMLASKRGKHGPEMSADYRQDPCYCYTKHAWGRRTAGISMANVKKTSLRSVALALAATLTPLTAAYADGIIDVWPGAVVDFAVPPILFPNWVQAPAAPFMIYECDDTVCTTCTASNLNGLTILNYGTAVAGTDIKGLSWNYVCGGQATALYAMSYAGLWTIGASKYPAWTWAGSVALSTDPCDTKNGCWCYSSILVYADIGSCPTDGASLILGPGFNSGVGGVSDNCNFRGPTDSYTAPEVDIGYLMKKSSPRVAAPGDTIDYTIYYGKPGTPSVTNLTIYDTQPTYTHYLGGSASPPADNNWDPNPGPPLSLRWTIAGPSNTAGGATGEVSFQLTVDWGNGNSFESGSGDVAAPDGALLRNFAHLSWDANGCSSGRTSNSVGTTIRRYMIWMLGDNDILFASSYGQPADEMIYSIFIKNMSDTKTWWNVSIWDTIPVEVDAWTPGYGFDDPCSGWTMSPSGCAAASPGRLTGSGKTILTWKMDFPPGATLQLRWKARVTSSAPAGSTAINILSLLELGHSRIVDGTGHQGKATKFVQMAPIVLRTTYVSFAGIGGGGLGQRGMFIVFYPLNRVTDFQLFGYEAGAADPWVNAGGVSQSITKNLGTCTGGFTCALGGIAGGTGPGCKAERVPTDYSCWCDGSLCRGYDAPPGNSCPGVPDAGGGIYHYVYKVVANSPVLWQLFTCNGNNAQTFVPSTSLNFSGFVHYAFSRANWGDDYFNIMNTSVDPYGTLDPDLTTTVHSFRWDYTAMDWLHMDTYELDKESHVAVCPLYKHNNHWRFVSSQAKMIIRESKADFYSSESNWEAFSPARNGGTLTTDVAGEAMYIFPNMKPGYLNVQCIVTNVGAVDATYRIDVYKPFNIIDGDTCAPPWMRDTAGLWYPRVTHSVKAGFSQWGANWTLRNPHIYGTDPSADPSYLFMDAPSGTGGIYRLVLLSGGPIEVEQGADILSVYGGGTLMHPADAGSPRPQSGTDFWLGMGYQWIFSGSPCDPTPDNFTYAVEIFCPKQGMVVKQTTSDNAYSITYTTTGPDQCVSFRNIATVPVGGHRIVRFQITGGNAIGMYNECQPSHKFFTAPFVQVGTHYEIILPPVVYVGQNFWITVIVMDVGGGTQTTYNGTASFTSTDPSAKIEAKAMDSYNYQYNGCGTNCGVKIFMNVSFTKLGMQTIVAVDTMDGSITGLASLLVVGADVKLEKQPRLTVAASGDTIRFQLCWVNAASATAFSFVITDAIPMGTSYVPEIASTMLCWSSAPVPGVTVWYSTATTTTPPGTFTSLPGTSSPLANSRWLRWTIRDVYANSSGCVCFKVSVN